jgi:beta-lactamase superfamily II metal-dependent hydrolase
MQAELWTFRVEEGLGNACALIFPDGSGGVVDWGTARPEPVDALLQLLRRVKSPRLRFVAATHPHADHTLGLASLLDKLVASGVKIDRLVYPTPLAGPGRNQLRAARQRAKLLKIPMSSVAVATLPESPPAPVLALGVDAKDKTNRWIVRALAPSDTAIGNVEVQAELTAKTPGNPTSLVVQFSFEGHAGPQAQGRVILPGDATPATLNYAQQRSMEFPELSLENDALVIPHHGSRHNWVPWFAGLIRGVTIVSAPSGRERHPSKDVLQEVVRACGSGSDSRLFCTSYAGACHAAFVINLRSSQTAPKRLDPCFGDIGIRLASDGSPAIILHDPLGPARRQFGHCRAP